MPISPIAICYTIAFIPIVFSQYKVVDTLCKGKRKVSSAILITAWILVFLLQLCSYLFISDIVGKPSNVYVNLCCNIIPLLFISLCFYQASLLTSLLAAIMPLLGSLCEVVALCSMMLLSNKSMIEVTENINLSCTGLILTGILTTSFFHFVVIFARKLQHSEQYPAQYLTGMILTLVSTVIISYGLMFNFYTDNDHRNAITVIIVLLLLIGINIFVLYLYRQMLNQLENEYRTILLEQRGEAYAHELQLIKQKSQEVRSIRHDLKNHAIVLQELLAQSKYAEAKTYVNHFSEIIQSTTLYAASGCSELDSIINYKLDIAARAGVKIDFSLTVPPQLWIDPLDINIILGNLLDNAIEGTRHVENDDKTITLNVIWAREVLHISIKNSYDGIVKKDSKGTLLTRKTTSALYGKLHGLGLTNVKRAVEKYNGDLTIETDEHLFSVSVILYPHFSIEKQDDFTHKKGGDKIAPNSYLR